MVNNPLIRPYFLGVLGGIGGVPLDSHDGWWGDIQLVAKLRKLASS